MTSGSALFDGSAKAEAEESISSSESSCVKSVKSGWMRGVGGLSRVYEGMLKPVGCDEPPVGRGRETVA